MLGGQPFQILAQAQHAPARVWLDRIGRIGKEGVFEEVNQKSAVEAEGGVRNASPLLFLYSLFLL